MNSQASGKPSLNLGRIRRKTVTISNQDMVHTGYLGDAQGPPLVVRPRTDNLDPAAWATENREDIESHLLKQGAVLFRGMNIGSKEAFERFALSIIPSFLHYIEGSSPRIQQKEGLYTSTEYPPEYFISMHNELSYAHRWPGKIFFYCDTAPAKGGETPIADSRAVLRELRPGLRKRFADKGVLYSRHLHGGHGAGLSWQTVFETDDRQAVEAYCREGNIDFRWTQEGGLVTRQLRPAVIRHPKTGEEVWFNQADQWHPSNFGQDVSSALESTDDPDGPPLNAFFGDGTPFKAEELDEVRNAFEQVLITFPWQEGDVMLVDNMLAAHGRMPFEGPRKILVVMGDPVALADLPQG